MKAQIRGWITDHVLIVLRIMATIERPLAKTEFSVDVLDRALCFIFTHYRNTGFDQVASECGGLAHETTDDLLMALAEHRGHNIPFGTEIEEREKITFLADPAMDIRLSLIHISEPTRPY